MQEAPPCGRSDTSASPGYMRKVERCEKRGAANCTRTARPGSVRGHVYFWRAGKGCHILMISVDGSGLAPSGSYIPHRVHVHHQEQPTRSDCCALGCQDKQVRFVMDKLKHLEAEAARGQGFLCLNADVEVDATSVRCFKVGLFIAQNLKAKDGGQGKPLSSQVCTQRSRCAFCPLF